MEQHVHLESIGSVVIVKPSILYVSINDTVKFHSDDNNNYDIVIPNKEKFFVSSDGATIELVSSSTVQPVTPAVNSSPIRTEKLYAVSKQGGGGGIPMAPPKIIISS